MFDQVLAQGVKHFKDKCGTLEKEASELRSQLEMMQKRARAEDILIEAFEKGIDHSLRPRTIEDFLEKRAKLETSSDEHLEKVASFVEWEDHEDDVIAMSDDVMDDSPKKGDLEGWLERQL